MLQRNPKVFSEFLRPLGYFFPDQMEIHEINQMEAHKKTD